jgi:hypothetical protein
VESECTQRRRCTSDLPRSFGINSHQCCSTAVVSAVVVVFVVVGRNIIESSCLHQKNLMMQQFTLELHSTYSHTQQQLVFVVVVSYFLLAGIESAYTMHAHQKRVCTSDRPSCVVFLYHSMQSFTFKSLQELHNNKFLVVSNYLVGRNR